MPGKVGPLVEIRGQGKVRPYAGRSDEVCGHSMSPDLLLSAVRAIYQHGIDHRHVLDADRRGAEFDSVLDVTDEGVFRLDQFGGVEEISLSRHRACR